ncbi:SSI family serine proteinase inhibitor [Streptomyces sp. TRM68367]|uniref:SSI family serine proteinase inhibitor n=1 Tax=Streptomyces sp. TRM68367 TaxID=2758415 RepID=UPI00165C12DD|nr:SSI family serine proteinase inhibitor [Streptomyces sp. TRM68367]MBC9729988.1 hypothetical protein [Streptomyces sp. TRM68367]
MLQVTHRGAGPRVDARLRAQLRTQLLVRPTLRRLLSGATASVAVVTSLSAAPPAAYAEPALAPDALAPPPVRDEDRTGDRLTVTVRNAGEGADGTFELHCHPDGGSHPDPGGACAAVERNTRWGEDTFAPVPEGSVCTMQYGGPATAHVTGTWAGRPVDAAYERSNGCQIERWDRLVPLLPDLRPTGRS